MSGRQIAWAVVLGVVPTLATYWAFGPWALLLGGLLAAGYLVWTSPSLRSRLGGPPAPVDPSTLPAPTHDELRQIAEELAWEGRRYKPKSGWNDAERQAFLYLYLRDDVPSQHYRVQVFDPSGIRSETEAGQMVSQGSVGEMYPHNFKNAPPVIPGTYTVVWNALVSNQGEVSMEQIARDHFEVLPSSPAISANDQT